MAEEEEEPSAGGAVRFRMSKRAKRQSSAAPVPSVFAPEEQVDEDAEEIDDIHAPTVAGAAIALEDTQAKASRLKHEGVLLAKAGKFNQALRLWRQAVELVALEPTLHEMMAQALLEVGDTFAAIQSAEKAVQADPGWPEARLTLGRAQAIFGELALAERTLAHGLQLEHDHTELLAELLKVQQAQARRQAAGEDVTQRAERREDHTPGFT